MENPLRAARLARGWSQAALHRQMSRAADRKGSGLPQWTSMRQLISRWENDRAKPDGFYRALLCEIYRSDAAGLGLGDEPVDEGFALRFEESYTDVVDTLATLWRWDVERRQFLRSAAFAAGGAAAVPVSTSSVLPGPARVSGTIRVGMADVESLRDLTLAFRRADNRSGGGSVRDRLVRTLRHEVGPLLSKGRYDADSGRALVVATAEMTQLAGWMSYDCGMHGLSQRYLTQALSLATAVEDHALSGEILAAMAHQASYVGQSAQAVNYAAAAARSGRKSGQRHLVAEAAVLEAQGHAGLEAGRATAEALSRAEQQLDRADRESGPDYLAYLDEAYLSAKFGHVFRQLGDGRKTVHFAERSLDMQPGFERGRVFNLTLLAHGHAQIGAVDQSAEKAREALRLGSEIQSARTVGYLRGVSELLKPYASRPDIAALRKQIRYLRPTG